MLYCFFYCKLEPPDQAYDGFQIVAIFQELNLISLPFCGLIFYLFFALANKSLVFSRTVWLGKDSKNTIFKKFRSLFQLALFVVLSNTVYCATEFLPIVFADVCI